MKLQCTKDERGKILYLIEILIAGSELHGRRSIPSSSRIPDLPSKGDALKARDKAKKELLVTLGLYKPRAKPQPFRPRRQRRRESLANGTGIIYNHN